MSAGRGVGDRYLETARRELGRLRRLAERALEAVDDDGFFHEPGPGENSLAVLVKHVAGNQRSRWTDFLTCDGEKPDRDRDSEFEIVPADTRVLLMARWESGWELLFAAVEALRPEDLETTVTIRGEALTVLQAIERQLAHYAYHVGQIVQLARHLAGERWESLSIPRGRSAEWNARGGDGYLTR